MTPAGALDTAFGDEGQGSTGPYPGSELGAFAPLAAPNGDILSAAFIGDAESFPTILWTSSNGRSPGPTDLGGLFDSEQDTVGALVARPGGGYVALTDQPHTPISLATFASNRHEYVNSPESPLSVYDEQAVSLPVAGTVLDSALLVQPDGKVIVVGERDTTSGSEMLAMRMLGDSKAIVGLPYQALARRGSHVVVRLTCARQQSCDGTISIRDSSDVLGQGTFAMTSGGRGKVTVLLTARGRRTLRGHGLAPVAIRLAPQYGPERAAHTVVQRST